ncbi:MAG TPA: hypothetical protein PLO44_01835 [Candidatus Paceibacterota bacterium]|nr:hypothetical protein [Candidatus Paceibacterota bacterium]
MNKIKTILKNKISFGIKYIPYLVIAVLVGVTVTYAASKLVPPGPVADTMYSLQDIYDLATSGTPATEGSGTIETTPALSETGVTLTQVYEAVETALASVGGVDLSNMFNGSCTIGAACPGGSEFPGGTQAQGGIDDANYDTTGNLAQTPPAGRYETTWITCNLGNNYCGTGDAGANAKDEATGLVWSYPLTGLGGASWDTETNSATLTAGCVADGDCAYWNTDTYYSWDNSKSDNNGKTAYELCSSHAGWSLPHQKQLMQAYIDGSYGNLEPQGVGRLYWSATTSSYNANDAWEVYLSHGYTGSNGKYYSRVIRCVQE